MEVFLKETLQEFLKKNRKRLSRRIPREIYEEISGQIFDKIPEVAAVANGDGINERCLSLKGILDKTTGGISRGISLEISAQKEI